MYSIKFWLILFPQAKPWWSPLVWPENVLYLSYEITNFALFLVWQITVQEWTWSQSRNFILTIHELKFNNFELFHFESQILWKGKGWLIYPPYDLFHILPILYISGDGGAVNAVAFQTKSSGLESSHRGSTSPPGSPLLCAIRFLKMLYIFVALLKKMRS